MLGKLVNEGSVYTPSPLWKFLRGISVPTPKVVVYVVVSAMPSTTLKDKLSRKAVLIIVLSDFCMTTHKKNIHDLRHTFASSFYERFSESFEKGKKRKN